MKGMIFNLYKKPMTHFENVSIFNNNGYSCEDKDIRLCWMHYDFIRITAVNKFSDYFIEEEENIKKRFGDIQSMYLYCLKESKIKILKNKIPLLRFKATEKDFPFVCICPIKLHDKGKTPRETKVLYRDWIERVSTSIDLEIKEWEKYCKQKNILSSEFLLDWYGSFGTEDLVAVLSSDSIKTLLYLIEIIRKSGLNKGANKLIDSTNSFIFSNYNEINKTTKFDTEMSISLTLDPIWDSSAYIKKIDEIITEKQSFEYSNKNKISSLIGKYDVRIYLKNELDRIIPNLFNSTNLPKAPFDATNEDYHKYVYQSRTNWIYDYKEFESCYKEFKDEKETDATVPFPQEAIKDRKEAINDNVKNIEEKMKIVFENDIFSRSGHLKNVMSLLLNDFTKNMYCIFSEQWITDLYDQIDAFLTVLINCDADNDHEIYTVIEEGIRGIRETYIHINQANRMFFEIPSSNLRYTGSYNKVLRAYYGILKSIFDIASFPLSLESQEKHLKIVPMITFEYTPKVDSVLYGNAQKILNNSTERESKILVGFHLPYDALVNIPKYVSYLFHEAYHYISPRDRLNRNRTFALCCIREIYFNISKDFIDYVKNDPSELGNVFNEELSKKNSCFEDIEEVSKKILFEFEKTQNNEMKTLRLHMIAPKLFKFIIKNISWSDMSEIPFILCFIIDSLIGDTNENIEELKVEKNFKQYIEHFVSSLESENYLIHLKMITNAYKEASCDYFKIVSLDFNYKMYLEELLVFFYENKIDISCEAQYFDSLLNSAYIRFGIIHYYFYLNDPSEKKGDPIEYFEDYLKKNAVFEKSDAKNHDFIQQFKKKYAMDLSECFSDSNLIFEKNFNSFIELLKENNLNYDNKKSRENQKKLTDFYKKSLEPKTYNNFEINMNLVEKFYYYDPETNAEETTTNDKCIQIKDSSMENNNKSLFFQKQEIPVYSFAGYLDKVTNLANLLKGDERDKGKSPIWYRGHTDQKHKLLPTIYRCDHYSVSPLVKMIGYYDTFLHRCSFSNEINIRNVESSIDLSASMQHYGLPTHLLDWTEDAMVALYFALNPEQGKFSLEEVEKNNKLIKKAVYLLCPIKLNRARNSLGILLKQFNQKYEENSNTYFDWTQIKHQEIEAIKKRYPLINLSNRSYLKELPDYYPVKREEEYWEYNGKDYLEIKKKAFDNQNFLEDQIKYLQLIANNFPIAGLTSLLNIRIRAQFGTFVAFNLSAKPEDFSEDQEKNRLLYDWASLEKFQDEYLFICEKIGIKSERFLEKIVIDKTAAKEMRETLEKLGFSKMRVYPELEKICKEFGNVFEDYYSNNR